MRAIARDLAESLSTYAHTTYIRRTVIGHFSLNMSVPFDSLERELSPDTIIGISSALSGYKSITVSAEKEVLLSLGKDIHLRELSEKYTQPSEVVLIYSENGNFLAVTKECGNGMYHPVRVFA